MRVKRLGRSRENHHGMNMHSPPSAPLFLFTSVILHAYRKVPLSPASARARDDNHGNMRHNPTTEAGNFFFSSGFHYA